MSAALILVKPVRPPQLTDSVAACAIDPNINSTGAHRYLVDLDIDMNCPPIWLVKIRSSIDVGDVPAAHVEPALVRSIYARLPHTCSR